MLHHGGRSFASAWSKAASFYPANLGPYMLALWDAENSNSLTLDSGTVTTWVDTVGGIAPTQATAANKPAWSATSFNSRPGITFDGTNDVLEAGTVSLPSGATDCELWALVSQSALAADATARTAFGYGNNNMARLIQRNVSGGVNRAQGVVGNGAANTSVLETTVDFSGIHVVRVRITPTTTFTSVDDSAETSGAVVPATATTRLRIGANANATAGGFLNGTINFLAVTAALDSTQAALLRAFLKARGGLP